ncbi:MAG: hypothetical protein KBB21_37975 [Nannocystaceae bacterium]|nr:hypothetical protein [Nannocystaceae bacterium]
MTRTLAYVIGLTIAIIIGGIAIVDAVSSSRDRDSDLRVECLRSGGRIVAVHGSKHKAWICDPPRAVEVCP